MPNTDRSIREISYRWLCTRLKNFSNINLDAENILIVGKPQAGKSEYIFGICLMFLYENIVPIIVVRNFSKDALQLRNKLIRFLDEYILYMSSYSIEIKPFTISIAPEKVTTRQIVICMYNSSQIANLHTQLSPLIYSILIDEADVLGYKEIIPEESRNVKNHSPLEYHRLFENCKQKVEVSATVFDILYGNTQLSNKDIVTIDPPESYKGIHQIIFKEIKVNDNSKNDSNSVSKSDSIENFYIELSEQTNSFEKCHPTIVLHKTKVWHSDHDDFLAKIAYHPRLSKVWTVIIEDSRSFQLYNSNFPETFMINDEIFTQKDNFPRGTVYSLSQNIDIQDVLQWMYDTSVIIDFSHIVIKTGQQAGRSRSYISSNGKWHLTHQYYLPSKGDRNIADLVQSVRLCHNRPDSIPLLLYAPKQICTDIQKANILQEEQIYRLRNLKCSTKVSEYIQTDTWSKYKVPKYRLCKQRQHKNLKLSKVVEDDGWDKEKYTVKFGDKVNESFYTIIDLEHFDPKSVCYRMIQDLECILIETKQVTLSATYINKKLQGMPRWQNRSLDNIHGCLWTSIRKNKKLIRTNKVPQNEIYMWKENGTIIVSK